MIATMIPIITKSLNFSHTILTLYKLDKNPGNLIHVGPKHQWEIKVSREMGRILTRMKRGKKQGNCQRRGGGEIEMGYVDGEVD